jgi:hypothetical protein
MMLEEETKTQQESLSEQSVLKALLHGVDSSLANIAGSKKRVVSADFECCQWESSVPEAL